MRRVIISTVGTSLLTNQINRANPDEKNWYSQLRDTANLSNELIQKTHPEVLEIIQTLENRALSNLSQSQVDKIRASSAELNGIYAIYQEQLAQGSQDIHWLIATDTAQGKATAEIVETFLKAQSLSNVNTYVPPGLSTASTSSFSDGIDNLIAWMQENIPPYKKSGYKICLNLVGSFKSLQGYLNTIGMFYADEIIYIFEGQKSELITIPRLPIAVDMQVISPYKTQLALMDAGASVSVNDAQGIPEALVYILEDEMTLSNWGKLVWGECKLDLLAQELLTFPRLQYQPSFVKDYQQVKDKHERMDLQETLAKVSHLLIESKGNISVLKQDGGLLYSKLENTDDVDRFRITQKLRISCKAVEGNLVLRRYGNHDYGNEQCP